MDKGELSVAVQPSDGGSGSNMDTQASYRRSVTVRTDVSGTTPISGTSAVVDLSGRARNIGHLINPGSPVFSDKLNGQAVLSQSYSGSDFSENKLPVAGNSDTLVISDSVFHTSYMDAIDSCNVPVSLPFNDEQFNNQSYSSTVAQAHTPSTPQLAFSQSFNLNQFNGDGSGYPQLVQNLGNDYSTSAQSYSYGVSNSQAGYADASAVFGSSYMVTGLGRECGGGNPEQNRPLDLPVPPQYVDGNVYSDVQEEVARRVDDPLSPLNGLQMDFSIFPELEQGIPLIADYVHSVSMEDPMLDEICFPNQPSIQATEESKQRPGVIGENLDLIKMMSMKPKRKIHPGLVAPNHLVPQSQLPPSPKTPMTPYSTYTTSPSTPMGYPVQASSPANSMRTDSVPSPAPSLPPETPVTPAPSNQGPFSLKSYVEKGFRYFELIVRNDLCYEDQVMAGKALFYCAQMSMKFKEFVANPLDLKSANNTPAQLCESTFDSVNPKLVFKIPANCKPLDKFLRDNTDKIDLRVRHFLLQQVLNLMATIHTRGNEDRMNFWGSFLVWVAPDMGVHILPDFPDMLRKMEQARDYPGVDPRLQDSQAIAELYQNMFKPYIFCDSSWVSPGLNKLLVSRFEGILVNPSSASRMAEIARNFGERRLCRIEVDIGLDTVIYCLEHETLQRALSPLENMVPPGIAAAWKVQCTYPTVCQIGKEDIAIADRVLKLSLAPCYEPPPPYEPGLVIYTGSC